MLEQNSSAAIQELCATEHRHLIATCEAMCLAIAGLRDKLQTTWLNDYEFAEHIELQASSLVAAKDLAVAGHYRDAYNTLRMILEGYLLFRLVGLGTIFAQRFKVRRKLGDRTLAGAKARFVREAKQAFGRDFAGASDERGDVVVIRRRGIHVVDNDGKKTGRMMPQYWHAWKQYRPDHFLTKGRIKSPRFLPGEWVIGGRRANKAFDQQNSDLYARFFAFDALLKNMEINRFINKKLATRIVVHYNFLSMFTHSANESRRRLIDHRAYNMFDGVQYDHYNSELALLYVAHLAAMHADLFDEYSTRWTLEASGSDDRNALARAVERDFGYFWFIFNEPHDFDKYEYANRKSDYRKRLIVRPEQVSARYVRYYEDPLRRLKDLHWTTGELTTGNAFTSPFPRPDALR